MLANKSLLLVHVFSNANTVASKLYNSYIDSAPLQFGKLENNSGNSYKAEVFSAECTIGMVRGLTPLKHYGTMALGHYGNKV